MDPTPWKRAAELARDQFGVISSSQLRDCGFSPSAISRAVRAGRLIRIHRSVFGLGQLPTDGRAVLLAGILAGGDGARIAIFSAAALQRLARNPTGRVWILSPRHRRGSRPGLEIRTASLTPAECCVFDQVPCTTPSRTILDLAGQRSDLAEQAIVRAGNAGVLDVEDLLRLIELHPGARGVARLRKLLLGHERIPVFTRSELERRLYRLCRDGAIDCPDMNVDVPAGNHLYECDAVWPRHRLIVECDSRWHDNPVTARKDAERDERLTMAGWRVHRFRWAQIALRPARTAATLRHLIETQKRLLAASVTR